MVGLYTIHGLVFGWGLPAEVGPGAREGGVVLRLEGDVVQKTAVSI